MTDNPVVLGARRSGINSPQECHSFHTRMTPRDVTGRFSLVSRPMVTKEQEAEWVARFESIGEATLRSDLQLRNGVGVGISGDPMLQVAFKWLRDKERQREGRDSKTFAYVKWTYYAASGAVVVGVVGIILGIAGIVVTLRH
jgi:hypothetical protein